MKAYFAVLKNYRVLLYKGILQNLLYFLGYTKEDVNIKDTNVLDWKRVKTLLDDEHFYSRIKTYSHRGSKNAEVKPYAYINRLLE